MKEKTIHFTNIYELQKYTHEQTKRQTEYNITQLKRRIEFLTDQLKEIEN